MSITGSPIQAAFITGLSAASVFGPGQVSDNYAVMESTSACCCIVGFTGLELEAHTFGNNRGGTWDFLLEAKLRDTGDAETLMQNVVRITDKVLLYLQSDDTLQGTVQGIGAIRASREPGVAETTGGGHTWLPIDILVQVQVWDD